ncbi:hypothetical protein QG516_19950 [Pedobacter gandavensis]|uniref:hypothetical protein n=1 Tax=Pedobacter TaxID=84567 RepID=UPI001C9A13D4|nr:MULTISPECIES: hypothetical protein [Pedobacter]WGQ08788.1 hypothetical protein QG516_19950 [Pedobacter gandavensis]
MPQPNSYTAPEYEYIDLSYIETLSNGDLAFEKEIVEIFIDQILEDLHLLNTNFNEGNFNQLKQSAHYMLPSISILGLENKLKTELEALDALDAPYKMLKKHVHTITTVCQKARNEAISLVHTLS